MAALQQAANLPVTGVLDEQTLLLLDGADTTTTTNNEALVPQTVNVDNTNNTMPTVTFRETVGPMVSPN